MGQKPTFLVAKKRHFQMAKNLHFNLAIDRSKINQVQKIEM